MTWSRSRDSRALFFAAPPGARFAALVPSTLVSLLLVSILLTASCTDAPSPRRVMVLGFDGVDPRAVDLLMSEGKLPHFARLRQEGAYAPLHSSPPLLSPVVWTTVATGTTPDRHRIGHFVAINPQTGAQLPVTSRMRHTKALWNILSDAGRRVAVVGWWATWPAETVHGSIVSDHLCYHFLFQEGMKGGGEAVGLTHPPALARALAPRIRRPSDVTAEIAAKFVTVPPAELDRPFDFNDDLGHFRWAVATADTYRGIGLHLWQEERPDLLMVYIEATDSLSHLFGHLFRARGLSGELAEQQRRYGEAVERIYVRADEILGEFMAAMDGNTALVVLSDHGFELGQLQNDPSKTRDMRRVSELYHTPLGILYLYGNGVKQHARIDNPTTLDIAPTVLTLAGVAPARDMTGRVLAEALTVPDPARVPSYETDQAPGEQAATGDPDVDPEILAKLKSLGYIDAASPAGDRNVAAILFEQGRIKEAAEAYQKIVEREPEDGAARASLAGALGALGRYDEALVQLDEAVRLEPLNPESYHNRAVIYEKRGEKEAASREYRTALRYSPQYEPSRAALVRLTGSAALTSTPLTEAEQRASALAEEAATAAKRGDYTDAIKKLDEAERLAPRYALVYQYRANVAYLMGDRAAAIAALEKGLALEPDNALFRNNLANMKKDQPR